MDDRDDANPVPEQDVLFTLAQLRASRVGKLRLAVRIPSDASGVTSLSIHVTVPSGTSTAVKSAD